MAKSKVADVMESNPEVSGSQEKMPDNKSEVVRQIIAELQSKKIKIGKKTVLARISEKFGAKAAKDLENGISTNINNAKKKLGIAKTRGVAPKPKIQATPAAQVSSNGAAEREPASNYAGITSDLGLVLELSKKYGAEELLKLADELPGLVGKFGRNEFSSMLTMLGKK